ncbi:tyrosine-type recombinase/integrase [Dictyobacter aurantiacus]|uniref:Tyrosine recombinase XerC n=1 Tax=Dictyobacter aurantiacus TaxID=1936993 RepID=A0A401ZFF4_9CHLR|nr:tyrosine-type recombinase/integrase [Dictyobacter aurantiacus]GCE05597.1 hypothetical protein KDAU_29260 [Dictyobacter aurantiacus]
MRLDETVNHYLRTLETRRLSPHTQVSYRHMLKEMLRLLFELCGIDDLEKVTVFHLRECVQYLLTTPAENQRGRFSKAGVTLAPSSVCVYIRRWKTFFSWCLAEELIAKNPALRLEYPKVDDKVLDTFTVEQIDNMLKVFDLSTDAGFRDYVIILLMLDTGLRRSEIASLKVEDVHDTYISVFGKGRKERQIGIHPQIGTLLWKYIHKYRRPGRPDEPILFISLSKRNYGLPFGRGGMEGLMKRLKALTNIDDVRLSAHTFRHTFACMYLDEGGDLFSLSRELGHTNVKTTERYLRSFTSKNARQHHTAHSPINRIQLRPGRSSNRVKGEPKK